MLTAVCLSACAYTRPSESAASQITSAAELTLDPVTGILGSQLTITGMRFPAISAIRIRMETSMGNRDPQFIGEVKTDDTGTFRILFIVPATWPDGKNIMDSALIFHASTLDNAVQANATYHNASSVGVDTTHNNTSAPTAIPSPLKPVPSIKLSPSAGSINMRVDVQALDFPPDQPLQVQLGLPEYGVDAMIYGTARSDRSGASAVIITIPERWSDGRSLLEPLIVVVVSTQDRSATATAPLSLVSRITSTTSAATASANALTKPAVTDAVTHTNSTNLITTTSPANIDPIQAAIHFLNALLRDPTGETTVSYLSQRLRSEISSDWVLPTGLGIQPGYTSFAVVLLSRDESKVVMQATLTYESGASTRIFSLLLEDGAWRIDNVIAGSH